MKTIDWESLTFVNNYVFQEVLKNKELCKYLIERILHIQIKDIRYLKAFGLMCMWRIRKERYWTSKCR